MISSMSPIPEKEFPTIDVRRDTVTARLLSSDLTPADRDELRSHMVFIDQHFIRFRLSERLRELTDSYLRKLSTKRIMGNERLPTLRRDRARLRQGSI